EAAAIAERAVSALLEVEAAIHGVGIADVHLHELGGVDTIVDVVGVAAATVALGVTDTYCAALALGTGSVATEHGLLPAPAPATLALLRGAAVVGTDIAGETVTPTGAALLLALGARYAGVPPMRMERHAQGAGTRRLADRPNVLTAILGTPLGHAADMVLLETNVDDVTGELLAHVIATALAAGAADAWVTPIVMKKGRPAHIVTILADPPSAPGLERLLLRELGSLGVRRTPVSRVAVDRTMSTLDYQGHEIRVKRGPDGAKPEWDDVLRVATTTGRPARAVAAAIAALLTTGHADRD
ncbi:MAG: larC, partial [Frankiales bacterium]|nr:larC [Frankiales bacterium]